MLKVMHNFVNGTKTRRFSIAKNKYIRLAGSTASILFVFLLATSIFPIFLKDDSASGAPSPVESTTTLAMTSNYETASVDLVPSSSNGTFTSSPADKQARFGITTTNYTGYTVTIESSNDDGLLTNENTGDTLASITSTTSEADFSANTTEAATNYNGKWGYMPSKFNTITSEYESLTSGNYLKAPTTTATQLDKTTTANTTANNYSITLGARADYQKPSGTYSNTFILNAVANPVAYAITYTENTGDVTNLPSTQTSDATVVATSVTLAPDKTPERPNYKFKAWCDGTANADATICTGTEYHAGDTFYLDQTTANEVSLYAIWIPYIQYITPTQCSALASSADYITYDKRDEKEYTVRYINGDCWMTSNLQFTGTTMDSTTTNIAPTYTPQNPYTVNGGNGYYNLVDEGSENGKCYSTDNYGNGGGYVNSCTKSGTIAAEYTLDGVAKSTVWYNYVAATAGTVASASDDSPALYDVCPAGWKLPNPAEQNKLSGYESEFNSVYGGVYLNGSHYWEDTRGHWWGTTPSANYDPKYLRYNLRYDNGALVAGASHVRTYGMYVRCVRKTTNINDLTYMQDFAKLDSTKKSQVKTSMTNNTAYTLIDIRDSNTYALKKLDDNKVWMTQNLRFVGTSLDSTTSNVADTYTPSSPYRVNNGSGYSAYSLSGTAASQSTGRCYGQYTTSSEEAAGAGFSNSCIYPTSATTGTVWYNFAAATAGTIKGIPENTPDSTYDICPKGWNIPSHYNQNKILNYMSSFNPTATGYYASGSIQNSGHACWWSTTLRSTATIKTGTARYYLDYYSGTTTTPYMHRAAGFPVRCLAK